MEKREIEQPKKQQKPLHTIDPIVAEQCQILREQSVSGGIPSDVNGSYTGTPIDGGTPVQDADDL